MKTLAAVAVLLTATPGLPQQTAGHTSHLQNVQFGPTYVRIGRPQESRPDVAQTRDFILSKGNFAAPLQWIRHWGNGKNNEYRGTDSQAVSFDSDNCSGSIIWVHREEFWDEQNERWRSISDGSSFRQRFGAGTFLTASMVVEQNVDDNEIDQYERPLYRVRIPTTAHATVEFLATDQATAERLKNALVGLAKLCGAATEPY